MPADIPLMSQTTYAELLDRVRAAAFSQDFAGEGVFTAKLVRGRRYWYFQASSAHGRGQKYVGPETADLLERIAAHKAARTYQRDQRSLVAMLVRGGNLPTPRRDIGDLVVALANAGVFRLRGVLVGTVAYQAYSAMLGLRLPAALVQTGDLDIAQYAEVSAARGDATQPIPDILRQLDPSFRSVPHIDPLRTVSYMAASGLRVDFLTPNTGKESKEPRNLPAFGTDAQPLRFLDFLIRDPEPAVLLHGAGVLVSVPAPQRFALHKLIVARRRREDNVKRDKDLRQARALLDALVERRPHELQAVWAEAFRRGKTWQRLMGEGLGLVHPGTRDKVLLTVGATRAVVPGLDVRFVPERAGYDASVDSVRFFALAAGPFAFASSESVTGTVSRDALSVVAGIAALTPDRCLDVFRHHRSQIEQAARAKYLQRPIDAVGEVRLAVEDLEVTKFAP
jgi:hypothetical protein